MNEKGKKIFAEINDNRIIFTKNDRKYIEVKKGERVMINDGTIIEAGLTPDEARQRLDDQLDDIFYSKPVALVKKISRRIKK